MCAPGDADSGGALNLCLSKAPWRSCCALQLRPVLLGAYAPLGLPQQEWTGLPCPALCNSFLLLLQSGIIALGFFIGTSILSSHLCSAKRDLYHLVLRRRQWNWDTQK